MFYHGDEVSRHLPNISIWTSLEYPISPTWQARAARTQTARKPPLRAMHGMNSPEHD